MITPASHHGSTAPLSPSTSARTGPAVPSATQADFLDVQPDRLASALARTPAVRPEVIARGAQLAVAPGYPSAEIIQQIAKQIVSSPDPSETQD
jgi:hypothetical protein